MPLSRAGSLDREEAANVRRAVVLGRPASGAGQCVHVEELTSALKQLGHEIIIVAPAMTDDQSFDASPRFVDFLKRYLPRFLYELAELGYSLVAYRRMIDAARKHQPHVIYERYNLYMLAGVWPKRTTGFPMLLQVNASLYDERKKFSGIALDRLARWSEKTAWASTDRVLPETEVLAGYVERVGVPPDRITVIPHGIHEELFASAPTTADAQRRIGLDGKLVLGFVGFVREWHNLEHVVDLVADSRDWRRHLLVVGDGPAIPGIKQRAADRGVSSQVTIAGLVQRSDIPAYVTAFDIALQPDVVPYASPLKLFEYLALVRAIVAPDKPNIREILTNERNALLFDADDANSFLVAIERLCSEPELRARLGRAAAATIHEQRLTWINNARRVETLFSDLAPANKRQ